MVLNLQGDLDGVDTAIQATRSTLSKTGPSHNSLKLLAALEATQESLKEKVEALYASLNVHDAFPELQGIDLEFVRTLLMARDLKINIRKRAIGSFFEWDKLDQATGGREQPIGKDYLCNCHCITLNYLDRNKTPSNHPKSYSQA